MQYYFKVDNICTAMFLADNYISEITERGLLHKNNYTLLCGFVDKKNVLELRKYIWSKTGKYIKLITARRLWATY